MFNYNNYSVKRRRIYGRRATATPSRNLVHKFLLQFFTRTANHFLPRGICLTYVDPHSICATNFIPSNLATFKEWCFYDFSFSSFLFFILL